MFKLKFYLSAMFLVSRSIAANNSSVSAVNSVISSKDSGRASKMIALRCRRVLFISLSLARCLLQNIVLCSNSSSSILIWGGGCDLWFTVYRKLRKLKYFIRDLEICPGCIFVVRTLAGKTNLKIHVAE